MNVQFAFEYLKLGQPVAWPGLPKTLLSTNKECFEWCKCMKKLIGIKMLVFLFLMRFTNGCKKHMKI